MVDRCDDYRYMDCDRDLYEKMIGLVQKYISAYSSLYNLNINIETLFFLFLGYE